MSILRLFVIFSLIDLKEISGIDIILEDKDIIYFFTISL